MALLEVGLDELADVVLLRDVVGVAFGLAQRELELLRGRDGAALLILQLKRKVAQHPVEGGEGLVEELLVQRGVGVAQLYVLGEVQDEVEALERRLVDGARRVVDEDAGQQQRQREGPVVVVAVLFRRAQPLGVHHDHVHFVVVVQHLQRLKLDPQPIGAGVDGGPYLETLLFF